MCFNHFLGAPTVYIPNSIFMIRKVAKSHHGIVDNPLFSVHFVTFSESTPEGEASLFSIRLTFAVPLSQIVVSRRGKSIVTTSQNVISLSNALQPIAFLKNPSVKSDNGTQWSPSSTRLIRFPFAHVPWQMEPYQKNVFSTGPRNPGKFNMFCHLPGSLVSSGNAALQDSFGNYWEAQEF